MKILINVYIKLLFKSIPHLHSQIYFNILHSNILLALTFSMFDIEKAQQYCDVAMKHCQNGKID